jgi:general L-amino acid transport system permease protein
MTEKLAARSQVLPPPSERNTPVGWARRNLFSGWFNSLLTLLALGLIFVTARAVFGWVFGQADWEVIRVNLRLLMAGQYPGAQLWRVWLCLHLLAAVGGLTWAAWLNQHRRAGAVILVALLAWALFPTTGSGVRAQLLILTAAAGGSYGAARLATRRLGEPFIRRMAVRGWVLYFPMILLIIYGLNPQGQWFAVVPTRLWGGLLLTFLLTIVGIVFSFPLGVLLALGRRSKLPVVRWVSIAYIELIRGVPLVTILFMASTLVPLFLPPGGNIDRVLRAMVGIILFSAAYLAENVRGGLQAIPHGQYEAAHALGLNSFYTMRLIILPQALRLVIPVLMGQFISLFKDTTLVVTIGLLELLGISRSILAQPQFIGNQHEMLVFITLIYWVISYGMSLISQRLETALGVGQR